MVRSFIQLLNDRSVMFFCCLGGRRSAAVEGGRPRRLVAGRGRPAGDLAPADGRRRLAGGVAAAAGRLPGAERGARPGAGRGGGRNGARRRHRRAGRRRRPRPARPLPAPRRTGGPGTTASAEVSTLYLLVKLDWKCIESNSILDELRALDVDLTSTPVATTAAPMGSGWRLPHLRGEFGDVLDAGDVGWAARFVEQLVATPAVGAAQPSSPLWSTIQPARKRRRSTSPAGPVQVA